MLHFQGEADIRVTHDEANRLATKLFNAHMIDRFESFRRRDIFIDNVNRFQRLYPPCLFFYVNRVLESFWKV